MIYVLTRDATKRFNLYCSNISRDETLIWITGNVGNSQLSSNSSKYNTCDNLLRVKVLQEPNGFNNEALLILSLIGPRMKFESMNGGASKNGNIAIQLIPCNVDLIVNMQHGILKPLSLA